MCENPEPEYVPVPVAAAREIAEKCGKSMVVILAYDRAHEKTHTTTYGVTPQEKQIAADVGERCARMLSGDEGFAQSRSYEDFRHVDAAERAAKLEWYGKLLKSASHAISSLLAVREGMTDEALESLRDDIEAALTGST